MGRQELASIRAAAREIGGNDYKPRITFVICAKRHYMRFYAVADKDKDRTGNLSAGTVVDSGVTDPFIFEFYRESTRDVLVIFYLLFLLAHTRSLQLRQHRS